MSEVQMNNSSNGGSSNRFPPKHLLKVNADYDCHDLKYLLIIDSKWFIRFIIKHFLRRKVAIWKLISELYLVYFVFNFDLSKTFCEKFILDSN